MITKIQNTSSTLEKALDVAWLRNEVISNNIANVNTPNFKKSHVEFEEYFNSASKIGSIKKDTKYLSIGKDKFDKQANAKVTKDINSSTRKDGNNVDIDVEMAELAKNTIMYNSLISQVSRELSRIKSVINEGRR